MENISKIVLSQNGGEKIGYVLDVAWNFNDMDKTGYYIVDEETEGELLLRNEDILCISKDVLLIEDSSKLEFVSDYGGSLIGKEVFDENGISYGFVCKLKIVKNKCEKIVTEKCEILAKNIKFVGKDVVFLEFEKKTKKKIKKIFPRIESGNLVQIQTVSHSSYAQKPEKINLSASYYVGKIATQDILGYNNEKVVLKGEIISKAIVEKAKKHNKLNQLFFVIKR